MPSLRRYFAEAPPPTPDDVEQPLWNAGAEATYSDRDKYFSAVLEQYKLYIEMADRVSMRRSLANTFFLSFNTAIFAAIGLLIIQRHIPSRWLLVFPLVILVAQCMTWFWIVRSYRQLNSGKWAVVGALEKRLPASPWWSAEWEALGRGEDTTKYWPLTHIEQLVPILFVVSYLGAFIAIIAA